jgi:hypothetical protein
MPPWLAPSDSPPLQIAARYAEFHEIREVSSSAYRRLDFPLLVAVAGRDVNTDY